MMIGQNAELSYLIMLSLDTLKDDLFAEGDFYPGNQLQNVLKVPVSFWKEHKELWEGVHAVIKDRIEEILERNLSVQTFMMLCFNSDLLSTFAFTLFY